MKELIDLKSIWGWCASKWRTSFGCIVIAVIAFVFGMLVQEKVIVEDCRFMGSFRDGTQAYNCHPRVK